jgi:hypothetical protein
MEVNHLKAVEELEALYEKEAYIWKWKVFIIGIKHYLKNALMGIKTWGYCR